MLQEQTENLTHIWNLVKPVWRILALVAVVQILGGLIGLGQEPVGYRPIDFWYGGVYATPLGFILGCLWQVTSCPGSLAENRLVVWFMAIASIALPVFGYLTLDTWQSGLPH